MKISLEGFWILNFLMDFSVLYLAGRGIWFFQPARLLLASAFGAVYALQDALSGGSSVWRILSFLVMLAIAFPVREPVRFLKSCVTAASISLLIAGAAMLVREHTSLNITALCFALGIVLFITELLRAFLPFSKRGRIRIRITYKNLTAEFEALIDTGNLLVEPLSALPVMIADERALGRAFTRQAGLHAPARRVRFSTVAGEGEILCIRTDEMQIRRGRKWVNAPDMWLGVYPGRIRSDVHALAPGTVMHI